MQIPRMAHFYSLALSLVALMPAAYAVHRQLVCEPTNLRFGEVAVGQSETMTATMFNQNSTPVIVSTMHVHGLGFSVSQPSLPFTLAPRQRVMLRVTFEPTESGHAWGKIAFSGKRPELYLHGRGIAGRPSLAVNPPSPQFGHVQVGTRAAMQVILTNSGSTPVAISRDSIRGTAFSLDGLTFPLVLASGQSHRFNITFAPQSLGTAAGAVTFSNATNTLLTVPLTGVGVGASAPQLSITPTTLNFGSVQVGGSTTQTGTLSASGASVTISSATSSNSGFSLSGISLPATIPAGQSDAFSVTFTPRAAGAASGNLSFASNAVGGTKTVGLNGVGGSSNTVTAASCNVSDVQNAVNQAHDGYTVTIPACSSGVFWTTPLTITTPVTLVGQGPGKTVLIDNVPKGSAGCVGSSSLIKVTSSSTAAWRISGFTIQGSAPDSFSCTPGHISVSGKGGSHAFRIDNIQFGLPAAQIQSCTTTSLTESGRTVTVTCSGALPAQFITGQYVQVSGVSPSAYNSASNSAWQITSTSRSTFTYTNTTTGLRNATVQGSVAANVQQGTTGIVPNGDIWGVIDHNTFNSDRKQAVLAHATLWGGGTRGDVSWSTADTMGTQQAVFMEDNTAIQSNPNTGSNSFACEWGSRCVIRYNKMPSVGSHGAETANRSVRQMEVYNNTFNMTGSSGATATNIRGGTGMVFGNTSTTVAYGHMLLLSNYREFNGGSAWGGACDGTSSWDENTEIIYASGTASGRSTANNLLVADSYTHRWNANQWQGYAIRNVTQGWGSIIIASAANTLTNIGSGTTGQTRKWNAGDSFQILKAYPCLDQPGRGAGDLINRDSPAWPNEAIDPVYEWNNSNNGTLNPAVGVQFYSIQANRDFYAGTSTFNGTTGVGQGPLAARPTSCTTGVGYWATDQGTWNQSGSGGQGELFVCTATNTWSLYYTPYIYPHPLTQ